MTLIRLLHADITGAYSSESAVPQLQALLQTDAAYRPLALYRHTVNVSKPVKEAFITVASAGLHEIMLNGRKVGNHRLDPMFTRFDRRVLSVMHDVTGLMREGGNVVTVELGNGWYNHQSTAVWFFHEASWRNRPRFAANLLIRYEDGTEELVKDSKPTERGVQLELSGSTMVKIIDNSKTFDDTKDHWSRDEVNFVAARELFNGVGGNQFGVSIGAVIYYVVIQIVLTMGLNSNDLKLFSALVVAVFLAVPYWKSKHTRSKVKPAAAKEAPHA